MEGGMVVRVLHTDEAEQKLAEKVSRMDDVLTRLRERIRKGERLLGGELEDWACN